jgi:RNA-dependent RNA polymerase
MQEIPDIERNGYNFTDGCGFISPDYAEKIANTLNLTFVPSAFQVSNALLHC